MKTVTLDVRPPGDSMSDFVRVWKTGKPEKSARISFATPELLWQVLTAKRWELLKALCGVGPVSIREAARQLQLKPAMPVQLEDLADPAKLKRWADEKHMLAFGLRPPEPSAPTLDILIRPKIDFSKAWQRRIERIVGNHHVQLAHIDDLISLKTGTGRQRDQADIAALERLKQLRET